MGCDCISLCLFRNPPLGCRVGVPITDIQDTVSSWCRHPWQIFVQTPHPLPHSLAHREMRWYVFFFFVTNLAPRGEFFSKSEHSTETSSRSRQNKSEAYCEKWEATGWPFRLIQTSHWHQSKGCILVHGPHGNTELLIWCQQEVLTNVMCHPEGLAKFCC